MDFQVDVLFNVDFVVVVHLALDEEDLAQAHFDAVEALSTVSVVNMDIQFNFLVRVINRLGELSLDVYCHAILA